MEPDDFQQLMKARQNAYDLLRCFFLQEPSEKFLAALKEENILNNLVGYDEDLDRGVQLISSVISSLEISSIIPDLVTEFNRLFIGPLPIPLYESIYRSKTGLFMQEETVDVKKRYMEAGLAVNPGNPFPDDHIGAELEFIFFLCQKAAQAEDKKLRETLLKLQEKFFQDHLAVWISPLCDRLYQEAESSYFKGVARMTKGFVTWDYREIVSHFFDED